MMGTRAKLVDGDEWDALTRGRKYHGWRAGMIRLIKRRFWKRQRKMARICCHNQPE